MGRPASIGPARRLNRGRRGGLAPVGQGDVALTDLPAELSPQESGQRPGEIPVSVRPAIEADRLRERPFALQQRLHQAAIPRYGGRDQAGVASSEIHDRAAGRGDSTEVVHQRPGSRVAQQPPAERRKIHAHSQVSPYGHPRPVAAVFPVPATLRGSSQSRPAIPRHWRRVSGTRRNGPERGSRLRTEPEPGWNRAQGPKPRRATAGSSPRS